MDNSGTMIALRGKNGVVTAVDKVITSKMYEEVSSLWLVLRILESSKSIAKLTWAWRKAQLIIGEQLGQIAKEMGRIPAVTGKRLALLMRLS